MNRNGKGPENQGPMTGWGMGKCLRDEEETQQRPFGMGRRMGQGAGRGQRRGIGRGMGRAMGQGAGRGQRHGMGRGPGFGGPGGSL